MSCGKEGVPGGNPSGVIGRRLRTVSFFRYYQMIESRSHFTRYLWTVLHGSVLYARNQKLHKRPGVVVHTFGSQHSGGREAS